MIEKKEYWIEGIMILMIDFTYRTLKFLLRAWWSIKIAITSWVQKITIAPLKNGLSLNFTLPNIESAAIPTNKTIAAHTWVHLPF